MTRTQQMHLMLKKLNVLNPVFPKLCAVEDLQVCRESFQNCFLLLQIFCQNRENAAIRGNGERIDDLFF